ncbi:hypothetical protein FRC18_004919 [Serendipita sp. 400]|nr:hypothetical protein FRC18_004919 [Serendipita sp. 400]
MQKAEPEGRRASPLYAEAANQSGTSINSGNAKPTSSTSQTTSISSTKPTYTAPTEVRESRPTSSSRSNDPTVETPRPANALVATAAVSPSSATRRSIEVIPHQTPTDINISTRQNPLVLAMTSATPRVLPLGSENATVSGILSVQASSTLLSSTFPSSQIPTSATATLAKPSDPPITFSKGPPIIAATVLASVLFLAGIGSLVAWVVRSHRRRRTNRMEMLALDFNETFSVKNTYATNEKDIEGSVKEDVARSPSDAPPFHSNVPYGYNFTPPNSGPYSHPSAQGGSCSPAAQTEDVNTTHAFGRLPYSLPRSATNRNFGFGRNTLPRFLALDGEGLDVPWRQNPKVENSWEHKPFPVLPTPRAQSPASVPPSRKSSRSTMSRPWAVNLRCTLSSALEAVKQAAGDRVDRNSLNSKSLKKVDPERPNTGAGVTNDPFTPMALRPARHLMARRTTAEVSQLAFKSNRMPFPHRLEKLAVVNADPPRGAGGSYWSPSASSQSGGSDLSRSAASEYFETISAESPVGYSTGLNRHRSAVSSISSASSARNRTGI